jgi:hypothetical protein
MSSSCKALLFVLLSSGVARTQLPSPPPSTIPLTISLSALRDSAFRNAARASRGRALELGAGATDDPIANNHVRNGAIIGAATLAVSVARVGKLDPKFRRVPTSSHGDRYVPSFSTVRALSALSKSLFVASMAIGRRNLAAAQAGRRGFESHRPLWTS